MTALERDISRRAEAGKSTVIDEVQEIIKLPHHRKQKHKVVWGEVTLDPVVLEELREYVQMIALMYNLNRTSNGLIGGVVD